MTGKNNVKETKRFKWYKEIRIDLHSDKWPIEFENAVQWTDTPIVTVADAMAGGVQDIVLIFCRERLTVREPHAIQLVLDQATDMLGELDAHVEPNADYRPDKISLILKNEAGDMAGIKMDIDTARGFTILLWQVIDTLTTRQQHLASVH